MNTKRFCIAIIMAFLLAASGTAMAQPEQCNTPMTGEIAGSASPATGTFTLLGQDSPLVIRVQVTHNVPGASAVEIRSGGVGQTGTLISNCGGNKNSPVDYILSSQEAQDVANAAGNWYIIVTSAAFPAPGGAIRADALTCINGGGNEGQVEGSPGGEVLPEGLADYDCTVNVNAAQMVNPAPNTTSTGTLHITFETPSIARFLLQHNVPDPGSISIYKGEPGVDGTEVRRLAVGAGPFLYVQLSQAELEDYTTEPHYVLVEALSGKNIRGDIVGCAFDDGVVDEGEGTVEGEGGGEGVAGPCEVFPEGEPDNLECATDLSGAAVVPPTTSPYTGGIQIVGPVPPDGQYAMFVRHNVPNPTSISLFQGVPGQAGSLFLSFTSQLDCPFVSLLPSNFFTLLQNQSYYVEIASSGDANATIRADLGCGIIRVDGENGNDGEGVPEGAGGGEGTPEGTGGGEGTPDGEGEVVPQDLRGLADGLLLLFKEADGDHSSGLSKPEAQFVAAILTDEQFLALDTNGDSQLSTGELHRYAGPVRKHNGDVNGDGEIDLAELLRLIQLYNAAGYDCVDPAGSTEDGFAPTLTKGNLPCENHAADYIGGPDFKISLSELLRVIQLFNFGSYTYCPVDGSGTDDYCITN